jgi:hypothetical protein
LFTRNPSIEKEHGMLKVLRQLAELAKKGLLNAKAFKQAADSLTRHPEQLAKDIQGFRDFGPGMGEEFELASEILKHAGGPSGLSGLAQEAVKVTSWFGRFLAALAAVIPTWALVAGAVALTAGGLYCGYQWSKGDKPVQPGPATKGWVPPPPPEKETIKYSKYYIVRIDGPGGKGGILSVRSDAAISLGIPLYRFRHGGTSSTFADLKKIGASYKTPQEATRALAGMITRGTLRKPPLAGGMVAMVGGQHMTIDDWGSIDFLMLRGLVS